MKKLFLLCLVLFSPADFLAQPGPGERGRKETGIVLSFVGNGEDMKALNRREAALNLKKALEDGKIKITDGDLATYSAQDWREFLLAEIGAFAGSNKLVLPRNFLTTLNVCQQKIFLSALVLTHRYLSGLNAGQLKLLAEFATPETREKEMTAEEAEGLLSFVSDFEEFALKNYEAVMDVALKNCSAMDLDQAVLIETKDRAAAMETAKKAIKKNLGYLKEQIKQR